MTDFAWSPDGLFVASASYDEVACMSAGGAINEGAAIAHDVLNLDICWSPDSCVLLSAWHDGTVRCSAVYSPQKYSPIKFAESATAATWTPDGWRSIKPTPAVDFTA
jgi:WD40 repeat protein